MDSKDYDIEDVPEDLKELYMDFCKKRKSIWENYNEAVSEIEIKGRKKSMQAMKNYKETENNRISGLVLLSGMLGIGWPLFVALKIEKMMDKSK